MGLSLEHRSDPWWGASWLWGSMLLLLLGAGCPGGGEGQDADAGASDAGGTLDGGAQDGGGQVACVPGTGQPPRELTLPGAEPNGVFDPNLALDPKTGRLWIAYSGVTGPGGLGRVSTHLAWSDDLGQTFCGGEVINQSTAVPREAQPPSIAGDVGHWNHETPALVYDPDAPPQARWRLLWHRYLLVDDGVPGTEDRHFEYGWIAERTAASPSQLASAPERKLFSSRAYHLNPAIEAYNDAAPGGPPEKRWDADPDLGGCIAFAEPGAIASAGKLYVALFCFRSATDQEIVLVRLDHGTETWSYAGTLLTTSDAQAYDPALIGFNAADLVEVQGGAHRLVVSPSAGRGYLGCVVYGVDLGGAKINDPIRSPRLLVPKNTDAGIYQSGACTYQEGSPLGLVRGDTWMQGVQFRLVATGERL
jgi:hypothetical protein